MKILRQETESDGFAVFEDGTMLYLPGQDWNEWPGFEAHKIVREFEAEEECHPQDVTCDTVV